MFDFRPYKRNSVLDILALLCLFVISAWVAHSYLLKAPPGSFYQDHFSPAVMQACGKGFVNAQSSEAKTLNQFLLLHKESIECSELPTTTNLYGPDVFQISEYYLLNSVALIWKLTGINWKNVWYLNIFLFCLTISGAYSVFRLGMNPVFSFILSCTLIYSPLHLSFLPHLRDYSVAPFALWLIWCLGLLVSRHYTFKKTLFIVAILGLLLGVSFGFRSDLLICLPAVLITIIFFMKNRQLKFIEKSVLIFIFLTVYFISVSPIFFQLFDKGSSSFAHVAILGLFDPFSNALGLESQAEVYSMGAVYRDEYIYSLINDYNQRLLHQPFLVVWTKAYEHAGLLFLFDWIKNFPADFLIRVIGSINKVAFSPMGYFNQSPVYVHFKFVYFFCAPLLTLIILTFISRRLSLVTVHAPCKGA